MNGDATRLNGISTVLIRHDPGILVRLGLLVLVFAALAVATPYFLTIDNLYALMQTVALLGLVTLGLSMTMIAGEFDLSVGAMVAVAALVTVKLADTSVIGGVALAVAAGALVGLLNACLFSWLKMSSLVITVGMMMVLSGLAFWLADGKVVSTDHFAPGEFLDARLLGLLSPRSLITLTAFAAGWALFRFTRTGRDIIITGSQRTAAVATGARPVFALVVAFVASGMCAALAGALLGLTLASASATLGSTLLLQAASAAIIGGVALSGGVGRPLGVLTGVVTLAALNNGLSVLGASTASVLLVNGLVLLVVVLMDGTRFRQMLASLRARRAGATRPVSAAMTLAVLLPVCLLSACQRDQADPAGSPRARVILLGVSEECVYCARYQNTFRQLMAENGVDLEVKMTPFDPAIQATQVDQAISQKPDVLVVWPADASAIVPSLRKIKAAGIPLVVSNSAPDMRFAEYWNTFTGPDDLGNGRAAAQAMLQGFAERGIDGGEVVVIQGYLGTPPQIQRMQGFQEGLQGSGIRIVGHQPGNWDQSLATTAAAALFTQFGERIRGVYAQDDAMMAGVVVAAQRAGIDPRSLVLVGHNCTELGVSMIEAGDQYASVLQSPVDDGRYAVEAALALLRGDAVEPIRYLPHPVMTRENIRQCYPAIGR